MSMRVTLTILNGPLKGQRRQFTRRTRCVIGRSRECDLQLPSSPEFGRVSRQHCEFDLSPAGVRVRDLGSLNGTFLNGNSIGSRRPGGPSATGAGGWNPLKDGDELRVGNTFLRVEISTGTGPEAVGPATGRRSGL